VFWAVAGRTQAAEGKLATSFFAAEIGLDPISAFVKNSGALVFDIVIVHLKFVKSELYFRFYPVNNHSALLYRSYNTGKIF